MRNEADLDDLLSYKARISHCKRCEKEYIKTSLFSRICEKCRKSCGGGVKRGEEE